MTTDHRVHGCGVETALPDWPALVPAEVDAVLLHFGITAGTATLRWHSPRPFSATAEVDCAVGRLFVKRHHHRLRDTRTLVEEHRFVAHLHQQAVPVPLPLRCGDGSTILEQRPWSYEVLCAGQGEDRYRDATSWTAFASEDDAHAAGRALALFQRAAADYGAPARDTTLLVANLRLFGSDDPLRTLQSDLARRPALADWLRQRPWRRDLRDHLLPWHAQARPWLVTLPPQWSHGDWHGSNLLWQGRGAATRVSAIFDFGLADRSIALFDLATAIERNLIPWLALDDGGRAHAELDQLDALLAGYASVLPLDAAQLHCLAALLPLVHADFALSELEYFTGITGSEANAAIAYDRYLLGHADWFAGDQGRQLLRHLQRRAREAA